MKICSNEICTGCASCANVCNNNAITMVPDSHGFLHPTINMDLCRNCKLCIKRCPQNNLTKNNSIIKVYAALNKDDTIRENSSSGGIFSAIAKYVLKKNGIVFGATIDSNLIVKHTYIESFNEIHKLQTSKYVQSEINDCFIIVKKFLDNEKLVLFSGTPCQIDGLYAFLNKTYNNLYTIDILCHGVPSPKIFSDYIYFKNNVIKDNITSVNFRVKKPGWNDFGIKLTTNNANEYYSNFVCDPFMCGFLKNYYLRESCYNCKYANEKRVADITLGDYWGYKETEKKHIQNDDRGISLVLINTKKGSYLLKKIKYLLAVEQKPLSDAIKGNPTLKEPSKKPSDYNNFWNDYTNLEWKQLSDKYFDVKSFFSDHMSEEDRKYFAIPFKKRHFRHKLHCLKYKLFNLR